MEFTDEPIGYFITWTVYGTFLQGDSRRWRKKRCGEQSPQPLLEHWHRDRLKYDVLLLTNSHREIVSAAVKEHCLHRQWKLWSVNPRTNHVHVVVAAQGYLGTKVRDQLKANSTRSLREHDASFVDRPVWTTKGDVQFLYTEEDLEQAIVYVEEAQDRMDRGK